MIGVVVSHQQECADVRLLTLAGWNQCEEVDSGVLGELLQSLAIGLEVVDTRIPCRLCGRHGTSRPVIVRPLQRMDVPRVDAETEEILLREAHVLHQLPDRMLETWRE